MATDDRPSADALQMETTLLSAPAARCCGLPDRTRGLLYALIAVTLVAPDAVLIRWMTELDGELFQIVAWKSLACAIFNIGLLLARGGWRAQCSNLRANARPLLVLGVINTLVTSGFTLALALTVAARALLLTSLSPLWTALIGWLVLKDRLPRRTIVAVGFALLSVGVTFVPRLLTRDALTAPINAGDGIAFATGIMLSVSINTVRAFRKPYPKLPIPMIPISGGAFLFPLATAVTVLRGHSLTSGLGAQFVAPVVLIGVAIGGAYPFLYAAPKLITGAEISCVILLEAVMGPLWVYVGFGTVPGVSTLAGGALLLLTLLAHEAHALWESKRTAARIRAASAGVAEVQVAAEPARSENESSV